MSAGWKTLSTQNNPLTVDKLEEDLETIKETTGRIQRKSSFIGLTSWAEDKDYLKWEKVLPVLQS
jgi:hypothetical protein